jgi:hypothetical protein
MVNADTTLNDGKRLHIIQCFIDNVAYAEVFIAMLDKPSLKKKFYVKMLKIMPLIVMRRRRRRRRTMTHIVNWLMYVVLRVVDLRMLLYSFSNLFCSCHTYLLRI